MTPSPPPVAGWLWLSGVIALLLACGAGVGGDGVGALVLATAAATALGRRDLRRDRRLAAVLVLVILAHAGVAVVDGLIATIPGAEFDAIRYHNEGAAFAHAYAVDAGIAPSLTEYSVVLGYLYAAAGVSMFLGNAMSVMAFALGALVLIAIMRELDLRHRAGTIVLFGLMPAGVMFMSVTLREAYMQLFLLLATLATLRIRRDGLRWLPLVLVASVGLAVSHNGFALYGGFVVITSLTWGLRRGPSRRSWKQLFGLACATALVVFAVSRAPGTDDTIAAVTGGKAFEFADAYRLGAIRAEARTTYYLRLDPSSPLAFVASVPIVFVEYMVAPLPWQIGNMLDLDAFLESIVRLVLIVASVTAWRRARGLVRSQLALLIWLYLGMELLWSLGTVNWGTAIRHHLPGLGLIAVAGGPIVVEAVTRQLARLVPAARTA